MVLASIGRRSGCTWRAAIESRSRASGVRTVAGLDRCDLHRRPGAVARRGIVEGTFSLDLIHVANAATGPTS